MDEDYCIGLLTSKVWVVEFFGIDRVYILADTVEEVLEIVSKISTKYRLAKVFSITNLFDTVYYL